MGGQACPRRRAGPDSDAACVARLHSPPTAPRRRRRRLASLTPPRRRRCRLQGVDKVLVKMGARGSVLVDIYGNTTRQAAAPVLSVVDTTAAGDCFTGAYAVGLLQGRGDAEAMDWASECPLP